MSNAHRAKSPLASRLESFVDLSASDAAAISNLTTNARKVEARVDLECEGEEPRGIHILMSGIICRYKMLSTGQRRIITFLLPGELCDAHVRVLRRMDHSLATMSACEVATVSPAIVAQLEDEHPNIFRGLACASFVFESILREQIANIGGREAEQRLGHLFCELYYRMKIIGLAEDNSFHLPLTQTDLADAIGVTAIHANRTLQALRKESFLRFNGRRLTILDLPRLEEFSDFSPDYLHLPDQNEQRETVLA
jgi:CRP-like cAMP-binding protein